MLDMTFPSATSETTQTPGLPVFTRAMKAEDVETCGRIAFEAQQVVARLHGFPSEQPSVEASIAMMNAKFTDPNGRGMVAERGGRIVGSVFLNTFPPASVAAIGPLTVRPDAVGGVGTLLMEHALQQSQRSGFDRVRLVQSPTHLRSLVLYSKLGFAVREPLVLMQGVLPRPEAKAGRSFRVATPEDLFPCNEMYARMHGCAREFEVQKAFEQRTLTVVQRGGKVVAYATGLGFRAHATAENVEDLKLALCAAPKLPGPGFFVPARSSELLRWLFDCGARALWPATLMSRGPYRDAPGAFLPSITY
jgi:hypothetical protein